MEDLFRKLVEVQRIHIATLQEQVERLFKILEQAVDTRTLPPGMQKQLEIMLLVFQSRKQLP